MTDSIQPQNVKMAATWNAGGRQYERISQTIADSIEHCVARLNPPRREQLKRDFVAFHDGYRTDLGVAMPRDYLVTIGVRK
ncbi:MAG: hypothetical protein ACOYXU_04600 [Nitrospirota bacterium]